MSNIVTNILEINGTEEQVTKVREFIKGSNGESISLNSIIPMPSGMDNGHKSKYNGISLPDDFIWKCENWGTKCDVTAIFEDTTNRIMFDTVDATPIAAMVYLSCNFPEIPFHVIFSDEYVGLYSGEYYLLCGKVTKDCLYEEDFSDEAMEYYFLTHEYDRENWKKCEDGEWINLECEE